MNIQVFFLITLTRHFLHSLVGNMSGVKIKRGAQSIRVKEQLLNIF
jgi:hypothetical protein